MPGRKYAPKVIAAPSTAAPIRVARTPTKAATGAVSANDSGMSAIETNQSRLETRPSIEPGTWRCLIVAHTIVPAASRALNRRQAIISCQAAFAMP